MGLFRGYGALWGVWGPLGYMGPLILPHFTHDNSDSRFLKFHISVHILHFVILFKVHITFTVGKYTAHFMFYCPCIVLSRFESYPVQAWFSYVCCCPYVPEIHCCIKVFVDEST
jgi:hypothetical protein